MVTRRGFVRLSAAGVASLALRQFGLLPALATGNSNYRALVCVFMVGGNDANNTIIPMGSYAAYQSLRGSVALSGSALTQVTDVNAVPYAFHSKLAEMASLFSNRNLAVVANVGALVQPTTRDQYQQALVPIPYNLFSHLDQQSEWETSSTQQPGVTGWAGRVADYVASQGLNSSSFPQFMSLEGNAVMGRGAQTSPIVLAPGQVLTLSGFINPNTRPRWQAMNNLLTLSTGVQLAQAANQTLGQSITDASLLQSALAKGTALTTQFPAGPLGQQLKEVAQVIQVQQYLGMSRQIFFCSLGGFDTHSAELSQLPTLYSQLSPALAAFYNATQEIGMAGNVTTFTESEFSRTFQSSSSQGSDHGWGGHHLVMGGAVQGGQIYGSFPSFVLGGPDDADTRGRWIPTTSIDQYGATLCSWFGIPSGVLTSIFPNLANFSTQNLGFLA